MGRGADTLARCPRCATSLYTSRSPTVGSSSGFSPNAVLRTGNRSASRSLPRAATRSPWLTGCWRCKNWWRIWTLDHGNGRTRRRDDPLLVQRLGHRAPHRRRARTSDSGPRANHPWTLLRTMRIATWNINNVRKRLDLLLDWLGRAQPDVVALQEL